MTFGQKLKVFKVNASSLAESIIAMAILAVCIVVASTVLSSMVSNTTAVSIYEGRQSVRQWAQETRITKSFIDDTKSSNGFTIQKNITRANGQYLEVTFQLKSGKTLEQTTYIMHNE